MKNLVMCRIPLLLCIATAGCGGTAVAPEAARRSPPAVLLREAFEDAAAIREHWFATVPNTERAVGAAVMFEDGGLRMDLPAKATVQMSRFVAAKVVAGRRLRVSARVKAESAKASAKVGIVSGLSATAFARRMGTAAFVPNEWAHAEVVLEVEADTQHAEIVLVGEGSGRVGDGAERVWFDDLRVEDLGPSQPVSVAVMSPQQLENVQVLARAAALVRYRHPADQAARLDWNRFLPQAVDRVLLANDRAALVAQLQEIFAPVAPSVVFSQHAFGAVRDQRPAAAHHLARWRNIGVGSRGPYVSWREGRDPDLAALDLDVLVPRLDLARCKRASLRAGGRSVGDGQATAVAIIGQPARTLKRVEGKLDSDGTPVAVSFDMPSDAYNVRLGLRARGAVQASLESLSLVCDGAEVARVEVGSAAWSRRGVEDLFTTNITPCGTSTCLAIARRPSETTLEPARDVLDAELAKDVWIRLPLVVWTDGTRTLPDTARLLPAPRDAPDTATRLAAVASAWGTMWQFYPFFKEQQVDWPAALPAALTEAAAARTNRDTYIALSRMLTKLRDNHGRVYHAEVPIDGVLPIALLRFADQLIVVGAVGEYQKLFPVGSELLSIDGRAAIAAYDEQRSWIPVATRGWSEFIVPFWLTLGPVGTFSTIRLRTPAGREVTTAVPHLPREIYDPLVREPRPVSGSELAPGIAYADLESLKREHWQSILPALSRARAIVLDMRGYPSGVTFEILGHFTDREILSPNFQIPMLGSTGMSESTWAIRPAAPKLAPHVVVVLDGRAGSAAETILQTIRDNHLATLVGETSAGTNGNEITVDVPGGFSVRFTGMRVALADGRALQGIGIVPDQVVHPTLEGVRAGRDEVLEAAIATARRLMGP